LSTEKETTPALGIGDTVAVSTCVGEPASGATVTAVTVGAGPAGDVVGTVAEGELGGVVLGVVVGTVVVVLVLDGVVGTEVGDVVGTVVEGEPGGVVLVVVVGTVVEVLVVGTVVEGVVVGGVTGPGPRSESIEPSDPDPPR